MVAHLAEGDLHLPAPDDPADDLQRVAGGIGAEQGLWVEAVLRIAQQHPTDRQDWQASLAPNRGSGTDLNDALPLPVPRGHGHPLPARGPIHQHVREVRQARALGARTPDRPSPARRRRFVQRRIEPQAGDADEAVPNQGHQEVQGGEAAVAQQHDLAPGQPAVCLTSHLPRPVRQLLVPPAALAAIALRRRERGQERQRPKAPRPRDWSPKHQAEPSTATPSIRCRRHRSRKGGCEGAGR
jgi:hypothetical protein